MLPELNRNIADGIDKLFYKTLFRNLFASPCKVRFWDGEEITCGDGEGKFKIVLNEPIPKANILSNPSIAFGEAYMHKKIEIEGSVQTVIESIYQNRNSFLNDPDNYKNLIRIVKNNIPKSKEHVSFHYDIGNDFYELWLDRTMTYSCGYFKSDSDSLADAQINKVEHLLNKLSLKEGQTLLDIGCGWGQFIIAAAKKYNVKAMGITLSSEQLAGAKKRIREEGIEDLVTVRLVDYRELKDITFDRIVSVGMIEHVGKDHIRDYFSAVDALLNEGGISVLQSITGINEGGNDPWIEKYIFPGGYIPAVKELISEIAENNFYLLDVESLRRHYGKTLEHWAQNYEHALPAIRQKKPETFIRMWRLYLNSCAASFNAGCIDLHQFVFAKGLARDLPWTREHLYRISDGNR